MTTTTRAPASNGNTPTRTAEGAARQSAVKPPRRPHTARIALGAVVVGLSALGAVTLFSNAADRVAVIAVARDVAPGAAVGLVAGGVAGHIKGEKEEEQRAERY